MTQNKCKNKVKLLFVFILSFFITTLYIYTYQLAFLTTDKKARIRIENSIKSSPQLPNRFYDIYNVMYPKSLKQGQLKYLVDRNLNKRSDSECPCRLAAYENYWASSDQLNLVQKTFFIESFASQKECLNYYADKFIFKNHIVGISNVSIAIFDKEIDNLEDKEYIELILMMKNSSIYNRDFRPEFVDKTINKYLDLINHASKS